MFDQSLSILTQSDTFAVIEFLDQQDDKLEVAKTYSELVKHLYWKDKNVPDMVALARAGIQFALAAGTAAAKEDVEMALQLRSEAKSISYNLASFTWIGWDEPGITLDQTDQCFGLEAARMNLRLAFELDKGDMRISRAYWMEGAQLMSARDMAKSRESFRRASTYAARAGAEGGELIAQGFELLIDQLQEPQAIRSQEAMDALKDKLTQLEHGQMYISQLDTAWRVFNPTR